MQIAVGIGRRVVVDDDVDPLNIDTSTKDVSSYKYTLFESLERCISADTIFGKCSVAVRVLATKERTVPPAAGLNGY